MRGSSACRPRPTRAKTSKSLSGTSANRSLLTGALLGVATFAVYMIGSNRSFGYDAAATFANFVATPSLWDAFAVRSVIPTIPVTQVAGNDHVLVSLLSHVIYSATGSRNEVVYRLLPAFGGGATVGLSTGVLVRRFGLLAGLCAGLYIATDPLFVDNSRDLRGYSLAALGSAAGTVLPVGLWLAVVLLGLWVVRKEAWLWATVGVLVVVLGLLWLAFQPGFLYPRFFVFLVPALGYLMAAAIARWWVLAPVVALGAAAAIVGQATDYNRDPLALPQAAAAVERIHSAGGRACVIHSDEQVLAGYTTGFTVVTRPDQLADCDAVVVVSWGVDLGLRDEAAREFPKLTTLDAYYPAVVLAR